MLLLIKQRIAPLTFAGYATVAGEKKEMILEEGKIKNNMIEDRDTRERAKMKRKEK
jgi:hypothetical protein